MLGDNYNKKIYYAQNLQCRHKFKKRDTNRNIIIKEVRLLFMNDR